MSKSYRLVWTPIALNQTKKILLFYHKKGVNFNFSEKLLNEIERTINLLKKHPELGVSVSNSDYRRLSVFRFSLIYRIKDETIFIELFWDNNRDPKILKILLEELN